MRRSLLVFALASLGVACSEPQISEYEPHTGIITGTIFYPGGTARGNVIVVLFENDDPPPPEGTASPINLVVVPESALFHGAARGTAGDFAAPYTIPTVGPGTYQVRAFLDADGNFNPTHDLLAQPTAGDVGGGHVDLQTLKFLPVEVKADEVTPQVTVTLGQTYPVERPAFRVTSTASISVPLARPVRIGLDSHAITRAPLRMKPEKTAFLVQYADLDGDGVPDDVNGDHLPDLFPRVVLRRVSKVPGAPTVIVPGIIDPLPFSDALRARGFATTTHLDVILPPVAVEQTSDGNHVLPSIPAGSYEVIVISGTGQTWQVPNDLDTDLPSVATATIAAAPADPTQAVLFEMKAGPALPAGRITGRVVTTSDVLGDTYVVAFDARNPPPPAGTGGPIGLASIAKASFAASTIAGRLEAPFAIAGLANGSYILKAFADLDRSFSPFVDLLAQPSARDVGSAPSLVTVSAGAQTTTVSLALDTPVRFDRPVVEFSPLQLARTGFPATLELSAHPLVIFGATSTTARIPIVLGTGDEDGDNLRDLLPKVLLTRITEGGTDPRLQPDDPANIVIPGIIDPLPFMTALGRGAPAVPASKLRVILPPYAVKITGAARQVLSPPPAGRYRVNVLSATGQTWSVPSSYDYELGRAGTALEDPTQARFVTVADTPVPGGAIAGSVQILTTPPLGEFQVVVFAFAEGAPPPPLASGQPVAIAIVPKSAFNAGATAPYVLSGLATGRYTVRAFLDKNDDFVPWFGVKSQPDAGDLGGGHLALPAGTLTAVSVDALGAPVSNVDVSILPILEVATDRPAFAFAADAVLHTSVGPVAVDVRTVIAEDDVLKVFGTFPIQWVDLDQDGVAEDHNGDGAPDVFPLVVADLLDPADPTDETLQSPRVRIPGLVDPRQFAWRGFPAGDPTQVDMVVETSTLTVVFPPIAVDAQQNRITPPVGRYRVTVVNGAGQTWSLPNELAEATGWPQAVSQGRALTVTR